MCALSRRHSPAPAFAASHAHTISPRSRESAYGRGVMPSHLNAWQQRRAVARSVKCSRTASANCAGVHPQPMDGTQSTGRHQAGRRRERRTRPPPGHRERPASTRMDERCAGVARRCGARRLASRHERRRPIGSPQRTGKGGHEAAGLVGHGRVLPPEARETSPGAALPGRGRVGGGRGLKVWPGTPARVRWEGSGMRGKEKKETHARGAPARGDRAGKAGGRPLLKPESVITFSGMRTRCPASGGDGEEGRRPGVTPPLTHTTRTDARTLGRRPPRLSSQEASMSGQMSSR